MGGIAGPIQNIMNSVGQIPGQTVVQPRRPGGFPGFPGIFPRQGQTPTIPGFNPSALPQGYQSQYGNYGFDPQLQNYLDQQYIASTRDAGVGFQYDPTNQTFTGGTRGGMYNPIPLNVMQQAAGGNRDVLNPYFQSNFPQQPVPMPGRRIVDPVRPGFGQPQVQPANPQRGLGGLQIDKFRNRLG
jgi:hypothetical protein